MNILKKNISIKYLYLISAFILVIMSLVIYSTYAMFTANTTSSNIASLEAGATYEFTINGTQNFSIGANSMASFNISVNNTASGSIYYEIYYSSSDDLTDVIIAELVEDKTVTTNAPNTSGNLVNEETKIVPIVISNNTNSAKTITVGVTSGFVGNEITYGTNGYPNGTKITSTYNIGDVTTGCEGNIDTNNCKIKIYNGISNTYCLTSTENVTPYVDDSNANGPVLADGMIPVMYDTAKSSWVVADYYDKTSEYAGYDYQNKKWANAAMVTSATRETYMSADFGTPVSEANILAYYVWIPRYKYELFNPTYTSGTSPQLINVVFENGTDSSGTVTCTYSATGAELCTNNIVGNFYTHPAFTFGSTELTGIWVGKFETSGTSTIPTIKPNLLALSNQNISSFFNIAQKLGTNTYLTDIGAGQTDAHMMKNIEWGAVAYLKQSIYGLGNTEIYMNNSGNTSEYKSYTGRSGGSGTVTPSTNGTYSYDGRTCTTSSCTTEAINAVALGTGASTTGNITGIYDTSGGKTEFVMGNYGKNENYSGLNMTSLNIKYYDLYAGNDRAYSHLGDATGETANWYNDFNVYFAEGTWYARGVTSQGIEGAPGSFAFGGYNGKSGSTRGFRSVLVVE